MSGETGESFQFDVPAEFHRTRADKVVAHFADGMSRSQVQKLFEQGLVWRDDDALEKSQKLHWGDSVQFRIPAPVPLELRPVAIPLEVLYEDRDLLAVNKAAGMVVHPGAGTGEDTLVHALLHHCGNSLLGIGGVERPGIVHRLDRETSGVIVVAKSEPGYRGLARAFAERETKKVYFALVCGVPESSTGRVDQPIGRHPTQRTRMAIRADGRSAISDWRVLERFGKRFALVEVQILTGRTHQIRVHLSHLGLPIAGDATYGFRESMAAGVQATFPRVMLHAATLELLHPVAEAETLRFEAPLPMDFSGALNALRQQFGGDAEAQVVE